MTKPPFAVPPFAAHRYRPDIDGLRAVAVASVVAYHYGAPGFAGGFVGVDIFFVISGFLITGLIAAEMGEGRFSFGDFYARRVRRIFPALFAMLAAASIAACLLLFPEDFHHFGRTLLATALFATNIELWRGVNYFEPAAIQRPLLHLWSIAVEEQYYLVFPMLLFLVRGRRAAALWLTAGLFTASFAYSEWAVRHAPAAAFYLLPSRMWELMAGAVLALAQIAPPRAAWLRDGLALAGLALIGAAILTYDPNTAFPGAHALIPCLGAVLLIWTGQSDGRLARALSFKPVVALGLVSYSLYLWHWPIYAFAQYMLLRPLSPWELSGCALASLVLAALSWRFVEQPFRRKAEARPRLARAPFVFAGVSIAAALLVAGIVVGSDGFPDRFNPQIRKTLAEAHDDDGLLAACFGLPLDRIDAAHLCRFGAGQSVAPSFLLWGDSHADAILPAVRDIARRDGREGYFAGQPSCAPLLGVWRPDAHGCKAFNDSVMAFLRAHPEIKIVILEARWAKNADGTAYGDEGHGFVPIGDDEGLAKKPADNAAIFARGITRTVEALRAQHVRVVLIGAVPEIGWAVPIVLARQQLAGGVTWRGPSVAEYDHRQRKVHPLFKQLAHVPGVRAYFPGRYLCATGTCEIRKDGVPLYRDEHHLSVYGAKVLEPMLARLFARGPEG